MAADPLILTALLDADCQRELDALRRRHFPPERNHLAAHLTLFHHLPGAALATIAAELARRAEAEAPLAATLTGPVSLGHGVAIAVDCPELVRLRRELAASFGPERLTPQDRGWGRPHVTVQNKVAPETARELHDELAGTWTPTAARIEGLALWHYRGGPWEPAGSWAF